MTHRPDVTFLQYVWRRSTVKQWIERVVLMVVIPFSAWIALAWDKHGLSGAFEYRLKFALAWLAVLVVFFSYLWLSYRQSQANQK